MLKAGRQTELPYYYNNGKVEIGTSSPGKELTVKGRIAVSPSGIVSDEGYSGQLMLTKEGTGGQFINMVSSSRMGWSIGTLYDSSVFCIAGAKSDNTKFTNPLFTMTGDGNVGIGVVNVFGYKLVVNGVIRAKEVRVETGWADFVFEDDYELPSLDEIESHIREKKHLPGIPTAQEVEENGIGLAEMNVKLLQKIEELTLYIIDLEKRVSGLENE